MPLPPPIIVSKGDVSPSRSTSTPIAELAEPTQMPAKATRSGKERSGNDRFTLTLTGEAWPTGWGGSNVPTTSQGAILSEVPMNSDRDLGVL
jgi:hypothetical protein